MIVGIVSEVSPGERRVAMVPGAIAVLNRGYDPIKRRWRGAEPGRAGLTCTYTGAPSVPSSGIGQLQCSSIIPSGIVKSSISIPLALLRSFDCKMNWL